MTAQSSMPSNDLAGGETGAFAAVWRRMLAHPRLVIVAVCLAVFIPGLFSLPPLDRDESRFAQATKQMMETGDYMIIRYHDGERNKKPAGIHWLQAASAHTLGDGAKSGIWVYRVPSVVGGIIAALLVFWVCSMMFGREVGLLAALFTGTCASLVGEANISKTDGILLATVMAMQGALARVYLSARGAGYEPAGSGPSGGGAALAQPGWGNALLFWVTVGISFMIKGPIGPMVPFLTFAALAIADRDWRWILALRPLTGVLLAAVIAVPWYVFAQFGTEGRFLEEAAGVDLLAKVFQSKEQHGAPPGYYTLLLTLTFFPGSLIVWPALWRAFKERKAAALRFCLAWAIPFFLIFELIVTKLPHYTLPTYPALAILAAAAIVAARQGADDWLRGPIARVNIVLWAVIGLTVAAAVTVLPAIFGLGIDWKLAVSLFLAGLVLYAAWHAWQGAFLRASLTGLAVAVIGFATLLQFTLPSLEPLGATPRVAAAVNKHQPLDEAHPPIAAIGYHEPSLVFMLGTNTQLVGRKGAAEWIQAHPGSLLVVEKGKEKKLMPDLAAAGIELEALETIEGINYSSGGRKITLTVYRRKDAAQ